MIIQHIYLNRVIVCDFEFSYLRCECHRTCSAFEEVRTMSLCMNAGQFSGFKARRTNAAFEWLYLDMLSRMRFECGFVTRFKRANIARIHLTYGTKIKPLTNHCRFHIIVCCVCWSLPSLSPICRNAATHRHLPVATDVDDSIVLISG